MKPIRYLSLFSGIEAATCAWAPLGWQCVAVAEVDAFACAVLAHHYPDVPNLGDVTKITREQIAALGHIDVVVFGSPCQDFSVAGTRKGLKDSDGNVTRSGLFFDAMRIVRWSGARWALLENVPGIFSTHGGRDFAAVVGEMAGCEYGVPSGGWRNAGVALGPDGLVEWCTLDAQFFGLAQQRNRVFLVRDSGDWASRGPVLLEREGFGGHPAPRREAGQAVAGSIKASAGKRGGIQDQSGGEGLIARCVTTGEGKRQDYETCTLIAHSLRGEGFDASEDGTGRGTPLVLVPYRIHGENSTAMTGGGNARVADPAATARCLDTHGGYASNQGGNVVLQPLPFDTTQITSKANRSNPQPGDPCHPLVAGGHAPAIAFDCKASGRNGFGVGEIASTLRAMGSADGRRNGGGQVAVAYTTKLHNTKANGAGKLYEEYTAGLDHQSPPPALLTAAAVRRLTPLECERLQGFRDRYTAVVYRGKPAADGPRYKALGNSFAVPVARWIGERIAQAHAGAVERDEAAA